MYVWDLKYTENLKEADVCAIKPLDYLFLELKMTVGVTLMKMSIY